VEILRRGQKDGRMKLGRREEQWLERIEKEMDKLPARAEDLMENLEPQYGQLWDKASYDLL
jgi:hypothetical protein